MLRFAILGHKATTSPDFSLNDMPGGAGRMDVLCRCINSSFFLSHDLRRNTECYLILEGGEPHKTLRFSGETIRSLNPDERSAGALIKKGLSTPAEPEFRKAADGIAIRSAGLAELLQEFSFAVLDENGESASNMLPPMSSFLRCRKGMRRLSEREAWAFRADRSREFLWQGPLLSSLRY